MKLQELEEESNTYAALSLCIPNCFSSSISRIKNKFAIIGLGQFGMAIAKTLSKKGAEVIAIDKDINKIEEIKEFVSYAVSIDATDKQALVNQNIECV